ncbi:uncharacterized protein ARMOST_22236 [Armillaria ostoyae]|uniref:Uncharacterized protein n=1 Tax=Armillaria ostoyae TaxID=47428 RepID=A0A284SCD3_ARMOS|nr:uncharacterized protein ARMOST_22236 [Armillaria ostoyae]
MTPQLTYPRLTGRKRDTRPLHLQQQAPYLPPLAGRKRSHTLFTSEVARRSSTSRKQGGTPIPQIGYLADREQRGAIPSLPRILTVLPDVVCSLPTLKSVLYLTIYSLKLRGHRIYFIGSYHICIPSRSDHTRSNRILDTELETIGLPECQALWKLSTGLTPRATLDLYLALWTPSTTAPSFLTSSSWQFRISYMAFQPIWTIELRNLPLASSRASEI